MRMELELELQDAPGTLAPMLEILAEHGANVLSVVHRHELADAGRVPVLVAIEVPEEGALRLVDALAREHRILRIDQEGGPAHASVILTGHVFQARLDELLDAIFEADAEVDRVDSRIAGRDKPSAVMVDLSAASDEQLSAALGALRKGAAQHGLTLIEGLRGDGDA